MSPLADAAFAALDQPFYGRNLGVIRDGAPIIAELARCPIPYTLTPAAQALLADPHSEVEREAEI
jgi:hypothetical protein